MNRPMAHWLLDPARSTKREVTIMRSHFRYSSLAIAIGFSGALCGCISTTRTVETVPEPIVQTEPSSPVVVEPARVVVASPAPVIVPAPGPSQTTTSTSWDNGAVQQKRTTTSVDGTPVDSHTTTTWNAGDPSAQSTTTTTTNP
jgi:hypothetical protein